jgi:hypothetical protein
MRVRRNLAALLATPCLLSACGGGSTSVADPPVSSHPTSSAPTTQPPAHESPEHFIRRWAASEKRMENTGQTHDYLAMSPGCDACIQLAKRVKDFYKSGGYVRWGGWRIMSITVNSHHDQITTYAVRNRSLPTTYRESANGDVKRLAGGVTTELLSLKPSGGTWSMEGKAELAS